MINKPTLIIIAGPNGSGKTSITTQILRHQWLNDCVYINPDAIAQEELGDWNNKENILKAVQIAESRRINCINNNESLIFETVFSANEKIEFLEFAKSKGFFIRLFFVGTNHPEINAKRITNRVLEGGHDVPITKIISRFTKSISNCTIASQLVHRLYIYDNSIDFAQAKLLFRASGGKIEKTYSEINEWAMPIFNELQNN